jgi:thioredoxin 1
MMNEPIHVTDSAFEKTVIQSKLPVVVDFWAPWCGPCKMVAPILDKLAKDYEGKLVVAKVNTDENQEWAGRYGVQGIPKGFYAKHWTNSWKSLDRKRKLHRKIIKRISCA